MTKPKRWLTRRIQAKRWSVHTRTVKRWGEDPEMGLPPEAEIGNRPCRDEEQIEEWERWRIALLARKRAGRAVPAA